MTSAHQRTVFTVRTLAQARLLTDPLRLRILKEFVEEPRTTKQVADRLGEPAPKLYRHVDALVDAGLLTLKREQRKRGTTERYLQAVATRFEVDRELFAPQGKAPAKRVNKDLAKMARSLFGDTQREFLANADLGDPNRMPPIAMRVMVRAPRHEVAQLRRKLLAWLEECQRLSDDHNGRDHEECAGLIVWYSLADSRS